MFIFIFISVTLRDRPKKILWWFMSKSILPMFSSKSLIVSNLTFRRRQWHPTPVLLPGVLLAGESQDRGAWWAAVYGVVLSRTRLKWLSSSSSLIFRSSIHLQLIFVYRVRECSNFILLQVAIQFSQHRLLKRLSFLHCIFLPPCGRLIDHRVYFSAFCPVPWSSKVQFKTMAHIWKQIFSLDSINHPAKTKNIDVAFIYSFVFCFSS